MARKKKQTVEETQAIDIQDFAEADKVAEENSQPQSNSVETVKTFTGSLLQGDRAEYYKALVKEVELENVLLGQFSNSGEYEIERPILEELVTMEKELADEALGFVLCYGVVAGKNLRFNVEVEASDKGTFAARLMVTESLDDNFLELEELTTFVAQVQAENAKSAITLAKKEFNIVDGRKNASDEGLPYLVRKIEGRKEDWKDYCDVAELGAQIYVLRMLQLLSTCGEKGQKIIEQFKKENVQKNSKFKFMKSRRILDKIIEENGGLSEVAKEKEQQCQTIMKEYALPAKKIVLRRKQLDQKPLPEVKQNSKQEEKKEPEETKTEEKPKPKPAKKAAKSGGSKKSGSKGGGGKSGGGSKGGDKKKPKKKEKKKDGPTYTIKDEKPAKKLAVSVGAPAGKKKLPEEVEEPVAKRKNPPKPARNLQANPFDNVGAFFEQTVAQNKEDEASQLSEVTPIVEQAESELLQSSSEFPPFVETALEVDVTPFVESQEEVELDEVGDNNAEEPEAE